MWEFGLLLLLVAVLGVFLAQRFIPRGPRGELLSGTLLVTGVSPRPDVSGEQYVTLAGVINREHGWGLEGESFNALERSLYGSAAA